jgi:hypothetical protein
MNGKSWYPLWVVLVPYWLVTFALLGVALANTGGLLVYPLDDTYIHMAIGKNFVWNHVWGMAQNGFSSSTSSPLWAFGIRLLCQWFGVNDWAPFVLGFLCGNAAIIYCFALLRKRIASSRLSIFLLLIALLTPLPVIALIGMEHGLHGLLTLGVIYSAADALSAKENPPRRIGLLLALSALVTITRYEGLFLILVIGALFVLARRFWSALLVWAAGTGSVAAYGLIAVRQGWFFLPNSILLKGNAFPGALSEIAPFLGHIQINVLAAPSVLLVMIAGLLLYVLEKSRVAIGSGENTCREYSSARNFCISYTQVRVGFTDTKRT